MAIQDLTPQLRTRLSRVERAVGWFVIVASLLLLIGFIYYIYQTAQNRGWFLARVPYYTYIQDATGLRVGDPVRLMGFEVGRITQITATPPEFWYNVNNYDVFIGFEIREPFYGYVWTDSRTRIMTADLLGNRVLEVTKGITGIVTVIEKDGVPVSVLDEDYHLQPEEFPKYLPLEDQPNGYWLASEETPAITERMDRIANQIEDALPFFFNLTNQFTTVLSNTANITARADELLFTVQPVMTNLTVITANLTDPRGSFGEWLLPAGLQAQLDNSLFAAESTLHTAETNLVLLATSLHLSLQNLANITSNLNVQVQQNDEILAEISSAVIAAEEFMQGMQGHWLLRGAFREPRPDPPPPPEGPLFDRRRW